MTIEEAADALMGAFNKMPAEKQRAYFDRLKDDRFDTEPAIALQQELIKRMKAEMGMP